MSNDTPSLAARHLFLYWRLRPNGTAARMLAARERYWRLVRRLLETEEALEDYGWQEVA